MSALASFGLRDVRLHRDRHTTGGGDRGNHGARFGLTVPIVDNHTCPGQRELLAYRSPNVAASAGNNCRLTCQITHVISCYSINW